MVGPTGGRSAVVVGDTGPAAMDWIGLVKKPNKPNWVVVVVVVVVVSVGLTNCELI